MIVPCLKNEELLPQALESVEAAAAGLDVETLVVEDTKRKGPSWARNRALDKATGDYVFFCDADDTVEKDFFRLPMQTMEKDCSDVCMFSFRGCPRFETGVVDGNGAVREKYLPAFFGVSFDDVRRWNRGGKLLARQMPGMVWRCAYRRELLEKNAIRFDEKMPFWEGSAFISECMAFAKRVSAIPDRLYGYRHHQLGESLAARAGEIRRWDHNFHAHAFRLRLNERTGGEIWKYCEASPVLSAISMSRTWHRLRLARWQYLDELGDLLSDELAADSLARFPVSWICHPLVALSVACLRRRF